LRKSFATRISGSSISDPDGLEGWHRIIAVNQTSVFLGTKLAAEEMARTGGGSIQCDLEEEPQGGGTDVDGRYRRSDRRQPQLIAMDILGDGLVGRLAQEIGKPFDVADIVVLSLGAKPADPICSAWNAWL
jgi:hypothetical protein